MKRPVPVILPSILLLLACAACGPSGAETASAPGVHAQETSSAALSTPQWVSTGSALRTRNGGKATQLASGKVLITGGYSGGVVQATAELYDPMTGTWSATGSMTSARAGHPRQNQLSRIRARCAAGRRTCPVRRNDR